MRLIDADKFAEDICNLSSIDEHSANAVIFLLHEQSTVDIKTEVAREIFAEIESLVSVKANTIICGMRTGKLDQRVRQLAMREILAELTELKKKYTKEGAK